MPLRGELDASSSDELMQTFSTLLEADVTSIDLDSDERGDRETAADLGLCVEVSGLEPPTSTLRT